MRVPVVSPVSFCLALVLQLALASPALACHIPEHLIKERPDITAEELAMIAHGGEHHVHIPYNFLEPSTCRDGMADIFPCKNVDLLAFLNLSDIGGGNGNDLWGWKDPLTGKSYALVGRSTGTAFIDLSDPINPVYLGNLPTHSQNSAWRDIKTYGNYAYIVADFAGSHGMQVFDLTRLRAVTSPPETFTNDAHYDGFGRSHNVVINEATGFAYAVGSDTCDGGLHMINLRDPLVPDFVGCFSEDGYTHDAQCVVYSGPDLEHHGKEICIGANIDTVTIVDVTDKKNPVMLSRNSYSGWGYSHQGWMTEDQRYFIHDDEKDEQNFGHNTKTYVWDITNLDEGVVAGAYLADGPSIDHNQYVKGNHTYQANYRRGLRVLHLDDPSVGALTEAAYFDTYPEGDSNSFAGAWSAYPFFDDGIVLVSDINRGLFVLRANLGPQEIFSDGFESGDTTSWTTAVAAMSAFVQSLEKVASCPVEAPAGERSSMMTASTQLEASF
ncbi:MAG: choice-of-anchor B family protein [Deltaproteobacteria bacterium]|nr:choice-of-anchor B family protein [Deltaproteobacteria bacterium]